MRGLSSTVLSLAAMVLSSLTTYLTFFDTRYTLTAATADVAVGMQTSGGGRSDGERSVTYQYFPTMNFVLSNRGTRALVITKIELLKSNNAERCAVDGAEVFSHFPTSRDAGVFDTTIVEPGTVITKVLEFPLDRVEGEIGPGETFQLQPETALYCVRYRVFDPNGRRHEPVAPALTLVRGFEPPEDPDDLPGGTLEVDFPKGAATLVNRGIF